MLEYISVIICENKVTTYDVIFRLSVNFLDRDIEARLQSPFREGFLQLDTKDKRLEYVR